MIVVRAIKPGKPFQSSIFREEMDKASKEIAAAVVQDFERTVATWTDKPKFKAEIKTAGTQSITITVVPDPEKPYVFVDTGTKPHLIKPRKKGALYFKGGKYKAKTEPNVIQSFPGGASGNGVFSQIVHHPGTKARNFSKLIAKTNKTELQRIVKNALARFARRSGYGMT